jgi:RNA polymerase sigma-70 factor, ECF subfamily
MAATMSKGVVTSTHDIVRRIKDGDREAFSDLFAKYRTRLAVLIHFRLGPDLRRFVEVDDVLQETMLKAFRDLEKFDYRSSGSFMSWLTRIADHVIADFGRAQGRQKRAAEIVRFRSEGNPGGPEPVESTTPSRIFRENEELAALVARLDQLPEDYRTAIILAKIEGLTTPELAERLGKSNGAAALLLHRAIKRFRALTEALAAKEVR